MTVPSEYGWFLALIRTAEHGVATAWLYEWDIDGAKVGALVESFTFGPDPDFYEVLEAKYYEAVEGKVAGPFTTKGSGSRSAAPKCR